MRPVGPRHETVQLLRVSFESGSVLPTSDYEALETEFNFSLAGQGRAFGIWPRIVISFFHSAIDPTPIYSIDIQYCLRKCKICQPQIYDFRRNADGSLEVETYWWGCWGWLPTSSQVAPRDATNKLSHWSISRTSLTYISQLILTYRRDTFPR
jgi:hypothetical protein